jgi:hypothetical protein
MNIDYPYHFDRRGLTAEADRMTTSDLIEQVLLPRRASEEPAGLAPPAGTRLSSEQPGAGGNPPRQGGCGMAR